MTMSRDHPLTVLHYTGYDEARGGIMTGISHLAAAGAFRCVVGVNRGFQCPAGLALDVVEFSRIEGEKINAVNFWRARAVARQVRDWLRAGPDRIFHGHSRAGLLVALWLHWSGEARVVASVHCYGRQRWFYRGMKKILGPGLRWLTPAMKRHYYHGEGTDWSDCMPDGLGAPLPSALRRWPGGRSLRIGGAGMMVRWKRWDLVLGALALLPADCAVEFMHIGGPVDEPESRAYEQELLADTQSRGLSARVRWLGWQPSSVELLRQADAVVVPSDGEPFSMIALEALFAGVPVIATRGGGPEDFILEGKNGWLVPAGDAEALAQRFRQCLDPTAWRSLQLRPGHLRKFSVPETLAARWAEIYAAL